MDQVGQITNVNYLKQLYQANEAKIKMIQDPIEKERAMEMRNFLTYHLYKLTGYLTRPGVPGTGVDGMFNLPVPVDEGIKTGQFTDWGKAPEVLTVSSVDYNSNYPGIF